MLIDDLLMRQFLAKNGPKVTQTEADLEFDNFVKEQTKDGKKLEDFYRASGQTEKDIRIDLHTMLQWAGYVKQQVKDAGSEELLRRQQGVLRPGDGAGQPHPEATAGGCQRSRTRRRPATS